MLNARGVKNVHALVGGWNQWVDEGNNVMKGAKP